MREKAGKDVDLIDRMKTHVLLFYLEVRNRPVAVILTKIFLSISWSF
jgi:hypothetical protein